MRPEIRFCGGEWLYGQKLLGSEWIYGTMLCKWDSHHEGNGHWVDLLGGVALR